MYVGSLPAKPLGKPVKMSVLPRLIYRINTILKLKTLAMLFARVGRVGEGGASGRGVSEGNWQADSKIYVKNQTTMATLCYQNL